MWTFELADAPDMHPTPCILIIAMLAVTLAPISQAQTPNVIYGEDDRLEYYEVQSPAVRQLADATVALIRKPNLTPNGPTTFIYTVPFGKSQGLCSDEPFYDQEVAGFCSGFLVGPDLIVTAGHCISSASTCTNTQFVFDYKLPIAGVNPKSVPSDRVFACKELVHSETAFAGADFAVVRLDRPVQHIQPLPLRRSGEIAKGHPLFVAGYPSGLPLKVAAGADVREVLLDYFQANLDTYAGNSGSAVFNAVTGEVEGVLVRGERDFELKNGCNVSKRCADTECRGEDVTRIDRVLPYLNN